MTSSTSSAPRRRYSQTRAVCTNPECELTLGAFGLTTEQILELATTGQASSDPREAGSDPAEGDDDGLSADGEQPSEAADDEDPGNDSTSRNLDELQDDSEDVGADSDEEEESDETDEGAEPETDEVPCPACAAAKREGSLLLVPDLKHGLSGRVLATALGPLKYWLAVSAGDLLKSSSARIVAFKPESVDGDRYVSGAKVIRGVVLRALPFDGHVLAFGNQDMFVGSKWSRVSPQYGAKNEPPLASARDEPTYIRELQKDLLLLGYLGKARADSKNTPGRFDVHTLGAVLAFKQDLVEIYGIQTSPAPLPVIPHDLQPEVFSTAIHSQRTFLSPFKLLSDWNSPIRKHREALGNSLANVEAGRARGLTSRLASKIEHWVAAALGSIRALPHRFVLEDPGQPYAPFEPIAPRVAPEDLPAPPGPPLHASVHELFSHPALRPADLNSRSKNRKVIQERAQVLLQRVDAALTAAEKLPGKVATLVSKDGSDLAPLRDRVDELSIVSQKVLKLVRYTILSLSRDVQAWLEHVKSVGAVCQATAVYLKALSEGGRIGPQRRPAYRLATNVSDFSSADESAQFMRSRCRGWGDNRKEARAITVPEVLILQVLGNESGLTFTTPLSPYNLSRADAKTTFVRCGTDMNSPRRGTFDAVHSLAGEWMPCRGWGVGQDTESSSGRFGVRLVRGLPILDPGATTVTHPKPFAVKEESFDAVVKKKFLGNFLRRDDARDCTYQGARNGGYYDCHRCLGRFFDMGLVGQGEYGKGGVFVPRGKTAIGSPKHTLSHWIDLERLTPFSRSTGKAAPSVEDASDLWNRLFGWVLPPPAPEVEAFFRSGTSLGEDLDAFARDRDLNVDKLRADVERHLELRRDLPCSWLYARLRYSGSGEQAWESLQTLLRVVGQLDGNNPTILHHIREASEVRRREALGGG